MLQFYLSFRILLGLVKAVLGNWITLAGVTAVVVFLSITGQLVPVLGWLWATGAALVGGVIDWFVQLATDWIGDKLTPW